MKDQKWDNLLIDYIDDELSTQQIKDVELALSQSKELRQQLNDLRLLLTRMEHATPHQPSSNLNQNFYQFLEKEGQTQKNNNQYIALNTRSKNYKTIFQIAAAIAILAISFLIGYYTNNSVNNHQEINALKKEIQETKHLMMLSMLKQESASERIKAVDYSYKLPEVDMETLHALVQTMNHDNNINVRAHAVRALARFGKEEYVRKAFIRSLKYQEEAEIQILLIDILTSFREQDAVEEIINLLKKEELLNIVKFKAESSLEVLL